jgi:hypothetical protein
MLPFIIACISTGNSSAIVFSVLPTETITSTAPEGATSDAQYWFNTTGSITERRDLAVGGTEDTTTENWSTDPAEDGTGVSVKLVYATGTDRRTDALGDGWLILTSQRKFTFQNPGTAGPYSDASTYTVALSLDGGATTHDTQTLTVNLDNAGP